MKKVMLVSGKIGDFSNFINPLKKAYTYAVNCTAYISTARYLLKYPKEYSLIIIEIRMVTLGEFSLEETEDGDITGIIWFKKELTSLGIPVLFWSYDSDHKLEIEKLQKEYPNNKIGFIERDNSEEDHLLKGVQEFLNLKN